MLASSVAKTENTRHYQRLHLLNGELRVQGSKHACQLVHLDLGNQALRARLRLLHGGTIKGQGMCAAPWCRGCQMRRGARGAGRC
jgi:hypothetical protein